MLGCLERMPLIFYIYKNLFIRSLRVSDTADMLIMSYEKQLAQFGMRDMFWSTFRGFLGFLLLVSSFDGLGQEVKKVVITHQNPWYKEEYFALAADRQMKQGAYQKYVGKNNLLQTTGYYTRGQKDSTWIEYYDDGETMRERGTYYQGQKVGMWEYYTAQGTLEQNYDHTYQQVLFSKPAPNDKRIFKLWNDDPESCRDTLQLEKKPAYIGGAEAMNRSLQQNLRFPPQALKSRISGTTWVGFTIDPEGKTADYKILRKLGGGLDAEALRAVKLIPATWTPGRLDGLPVAVVCEIPITFTLPPAPAAPKKAPQKATRRKYGSNTRKR